MSVTVENQKPIESVMKKMGFKITDRLQPEQGVARIQLYTMYRPQKSDIHDTGVVGGKPAGGTLRLSEPTGEGEKDIDKLIDEAKVANHFHDRAPRRDLRDDALPRGCSRELKTFLEFAGQASAASRQYAVGQEPQAGVDRHGILRSQGAGRALYRDALQAES